MLLIIIPELNSCCNCSGYELLEGSVPGGIIKTYIKIVTQTASNLE